ncbi:hypothetical protein [Spartinivicinus ruber]|uniref:hypothetical protein n=1 Tax=Spartinivicinus ruber TaxID=2683272 RepID=UPI0013D41524|nr:hypothetical protein [Spartinivicinus ruber]
MHLFTFCLCFIFLGLQAEEITEIIYPPRESTNDTRDNDIVSFLEKILKVTENDYGKYKMRQQLE